MRKRVLSLCMALCMTLTLFPTATWADELPKTISEIVEVVPEVMEEDVNRLDNNLMERVSQAFPHDGEFATLSSAITVYKQTDSRWSGYAYGYGTNDDGSTWPATIGTSGCGLLSYTNAVYYLNGSFINPTILADYALKYGYRPTGGGTAYGLYKSFADNRGSTYGIAYVGAVSGYANLKANIQKGYVAICHVPGHIMAIVDYNSSDGTYLLLDSYPSGNRGTYSTGGYAWKTQAQLNNLKVESDFYIIKSTSPAPSGNRSPTAIFDLAESTSPGKLHVRGWAFDPDDTAVQLSIHVYLGTENDTGTACAAIAADKHRPDVDDVHHCGAYHGFDDTIDISQNGTYTVRVAALDATEGGAKATWLAYKDQVTISNNSPTLNFEVAESTSPGKLHVRGWAFDPDDTAAQLSIHVYLGNETDVGTCYANIAADKHRQDVDNVFHCGAYHGFEDTIDIPQNGTYTVRVAALDATEGGAKATWLAYKEQVTISNSSPTLNFEVAESTSPGKLHVRGWAFDPDDTAAQLSIHVYLGSESDPGSACAAIAADKHRPDVDNVHHCGAYHGFEDTIDVTQSGTYTVRVAALDTTEGGAKASWSEYATQVTIQKDTEAPKVTNASLSNISGNKCTFTITATDNVKVDHVDFHVWCDTWTQSGETVYQAKQSGNNWSYDIPLNLSNGKKWLMDARVYDPSGNQTLSSGNTVPGALLRFYTITFNANGGSCSTANKQVIGARYWLRGQFGDTYVCTYGDLLTPTRDGYAFDGWYTESNGGNKITKDSKVTIAENQTLYAHWKDTQSPVITQISGPYNLSPNGYTFKITATDTAGVAKVRALSWVDPVENAVKTWTDAAKSGNEWTVSVQRNGENNGNSSAWRTDLYAYDAAENASLCKQILIYYCTVTFDANGGDCATANKAVFRGGYLTNYTDSVDFHLKYGDLPMPTRSGYTFDGWYTALEDGEQITAESEVAARTNHTLYAHWTKKPAPPDSSVLQIIAGSVSAPKGSVVDIPVTIENNPGISGATLAVSYDKSALTLTSITKGTVFENGSYTAYPENGVVQWYHTENVTGDGVLFTFQFTVDGNAQNGNYNIAVGLRDGIPANLSNADSNIVNAQFISGVLEITSGIRGDATGDGVVAINDVVKVARAVGGSLTLTESEKTLADVTGDGVIAINDVVKLARYVAGSIATLQSAEAASLSGGESAVIEVATVSGKPGESVRVPVSITSNPGIAGLQLDVRFDNGLTLKNVVQGDILSGENFTPDVSAGRIQWYYEQANVTNTGVLFTLEFEIGAEAQNGDAYAVTVNVKDGIAANLSDYDFNPVNAEFKSGKIQIDETSDNIVINTVSRNGNTITANVVCVDSNATVFCAVYNNSGKMIAVRSVQITGESSYQFQFDGQQFDYAKAFIVDGNFCPLCESKKS